MKIKELLNVEETSGFFSNPSEPESGEISTLELIHGSAGGACDLFRVERQGKFRVLKCLKEEFRGDALYEGLLRKEFEIGSPQDHPHICHYYSFAPHGQLGNCIEMEWVHGRTLLQALKEGPIAQADGDRIINELCDALSYLHSRQILHRDLTPANVMLTASGDVVKLIDFGFSDSDEFSMLKTPAGTRSFTAPEVLAGNGADVRSEIWSLGVLIGLISGGKRHRSVVRRCLAEDPAKRYGSVEEVRRALQRSRSGRMFIFPLIVAILMVGILLVQRRNVDRTEEVVPPQVVDTVVVLREMPAPASAAPKAAPDRDRVTPRREEPSTPTRPAPVDSGVVDEIFHQATELFN